MSKMECDVIRDLIPIYMDGLASEASAKLVEDHAAECRDCRKLIEELKEPQREPAEEEEINFLKKTRSRHKKAILITAFAALVILVIAIYAVPRLAFGELKKTELKTAITVTNSDDGAKIYLSLESLSDKGIHDMDFSEKDGCVSVKATGAVKSAISYTQYAAEYYAEDQVKTVKLNGVVIWQDGNVISDEAFAVEESAHAYIGDASATMNTLKATGLDEMFGEFTIELQTGSEPYGLTVKIESPLGTRSLLYYQSYMRLYAYETIAVIDNLSYVNFDYEYDGKQCEDSWDAESAEADLGKSLKAYGKSAADLGQLEADLWDASYGNLQEELEELKAVIDD